MSALWKKYEESQARVAELEAALRRHHEWHQNIGEVLFPCDDNHVDIVTIDLSLEYSDSSMCEQTVSALSAQPSAVHDADEDPIVRAQPLWKVLEAEQAVVRAAMEWHGNLENALALNLSDHSLAKACVHLAKVREESDG
jgi:hypothetical protein